MKYFAVLALAAAVLNVPPAQAQFKPIPGSEAMNTVSEDAEAAIFSSDTRTLDGSSWKNLYLAFAVDARYMRDCSGNRQSLLCTFLHSSVEVSGNLSWTPDGVSDDAARQYRVVMVPVEFILGKFGREGPELTTSSNAEYLAIGVETTYLRDLGLDVEHRVAADVGVSLNLAKPLSLAHGLRWIGSVRIFAGGGASDLSAFNDVRGFASAGVEAQFGVAVDLEHGTVLFRNINRYEDDWGPSMSMGLSSEKLELKYLRSVCSDKGEKLRRRNLDNGCHSPHSFDYGGGVRYEAYSTSYTGDGLVLAEGTHQDRGVHRLLFFAELAHF